MSRWFRVLPALIVSALLILALSTPARRAPVPSADANSAAVGPCLQFQGGGSGSFTSLSAGQRITQPIGFQGNVQSCSLTIQHTWGYGDVEVVAWDPVSLAPDPTTLALSTRSFNDSALLYGWTRVNFSPPVITTSSPHVADPIRQTLAINYRPSWNTQQIAFEQAGDPATPQALQFDAQNNPVPLPGAHPLLAHAVCGGDADLQDLRVVQSVTTTNTVVADTSSEEVLQLFTVPVPAALYWAEVAPGGNVAPRTGIPDVTILDANGSNVPPVSFLDQDILAQQFLSYYYRPSWIAAYDFNNHPVLEPGHFYWLRVRSFKYFALHGRVRQAQESWDFNFGVGPAFRRAKAGNAWTPIENASLSFRLIGHPTGPGWVGVPTSNPATALRLRIAPNPSQGVALVRWAGAEGTVRLTVVDTRGRRIAGGQLTGGEGQWRFPATADDGSPLPAGVYFVRAVDGRGAAVTERMVIQR